MSADDQTFLDTLSSVPNDVKRFSRDVADYIDQHVEWVAVALREALLSSPWIPESARPKPYPIPLAPVKAQPASLYERVQIWVLKNKLLCGTFILGIGAASFFVHQKRKAYGRKRRAKRASNGARLEVVVIAGSPGEPITKSLALDLERRGFIVFIVCSDIEEEVMVQNESRIDIRPLTIDVSHALTASNAIERFASYIRTPQQAFEGARPHHLIFTSLIIIPSIVYPSAPVAAISPSHFSDLLNTRLLHPILLTQAFLPLLSSLPSSHSHHNPSPRSHQSPQILLLTPSIISSLNPPFHGPESLITSALTAFAQSLAAEVSPLGIRLTHLKLGSFDFSSVHPRNQLQVPTLQAQRSETLTWPEGARGIYAQNFLSVVERGPGGSGMKGSPLRELHNAVFDAMASGKGGVVRVGVGSGIYALVGALAPRGLVAWMMGIRRVEKTTPVHTRSGSENGSDGGEGISTRDGDYVSVCP